MMTDLRPQELGRFAACDLELRTEAPQLSGCVQSGPPVAAIIGDSHAVHLFGAIAEADSGQGWLLASRSSCPPLMGVRVSGAGFDCREVLAQAIRHVAQDTRIRLVVLSFYGGYSQSTEVDIRGRFGPSTTRMERAGADDKLTALRRGLFDTVQHLTSAGKQVVVIVDVPELPFSPRDCIARPLAQSKVQPCGVSRASVNQRQTDLRAAIDEARAAFPKLRVFDTLDVLCDAEFCMVDRDGMLAYYDSHHLSVRGSRIVAEPFVAWLQAGTSQ